MANLANSPLRYPGGKQILSRVVSHLIQLNGSSGGTYLEPYAGGAGVALAMLFGEHVQNVLINDADPRIYAFWDAVLNHTEDFVELLKKTPTTVREWSRQRRIYQHPHRHHHVHVGFATFFLNRCNRSGIIASGGPIGGIRQTGHWKIDARFNREDLERRIRKIVMYRDRISISKADALDFLGGALGPLKGKRKPFAYLDPPYYTKGRDLYLNYYSHDDHAKLSKFLKHETDYPWILSYDKAPEIVKLYSGFRQVHFSLDYSARERRQGKELMIFRRQLAFPSSWVRSIPRRYIALAGGGPDLPSA
jgi:DNA adenine methylase